jgi:hypothetical protein
MVMPAPAIILRFLSSKGVREAVKKYGKKAVDEAKKHIDDFKTKPTPGQQKINPVTKSQRANRETMRRSVGTGSLQSDNKPKAAPKAKPKAAPKAKPKAAPKAKPKAAPKAKPSKKQEKGTRVEGDSKGVRVYKDGKLVKGTRVEGDSKGVRVYKDGKLVSNRKKKK